MNKSNDLNEIIYNLQENQTELNKIIFGMQHEINLLKSQLNTMNESFTNTVSLLLKEKFVKNENKNKNKNVIQNLTDSSSDSDDNNVNYQIKNPFQKKNNNNTKIKNSTQNSNVNRRRII
jgi:hypothetical protein